MEPATWARCRDGFLPHGGFIDLIVPGTEPDDWDAFWLALRCGPYRVTVSRDADVIPLPESAAWLVAENETARIQVSFRVGPVFASSLFLGGSYLEVYFDPRQVTDASSFDSVLELMRFIARAVGRPVLATMEGRNQEAEAFLRVTPQGAAEVLSRDEH